MYVYAPYMSGAYRGLKSMFSSLELGLQKVMNYCVGAEN